MARIGWEVTGSMFSGLIPAMITPFDEGGEVDLRATEAVVEHFVGAGVDGISALGSTGEFSHLTLDERKSFAYRLDQGIPAPCFRLAKKAFDLRESLFDGVQIR